MAKSDKKNEIKVSPINGQPVPRGKPFTSETAREARLKRAEKERREKSITKAFLALMEETFTDKKTGKTQSGAEVIAYSVLKGAMNNNAKMVEIALAIVGETPATKIDIRSDGQLAALIDGLKEPESKEE